MARGGVFEPQTYLPRELYEAVTDVRVRQPGLVEAEAARRLKRPMLAPDGRLVILDAEHPGRGSPAIQDDPSAGGSRREHLARILRVLSHPGVDGVAAPADLVEDLYALAALIRDPAARRVMGREGRRRVLELFSFEAGVDRLARRFDLGRQQREAA